MPSAAGNPVLCPYCRHRKNRVLDSRLTQEGESIRRRRECMGCDRRFTTYETVDEIALLVVKKDLRRERFDPQKVLQSLVTACQKRTIPMARIQEIVRMAENLALESQSNECTTKEIGDLVLGQLRETDPVAYVRFASVYREFEDEQEFVDIITEMRGGDR